MERFVKVQDFKKGLKGLEKGSEYETSKIILKITNITSKFKQSQKNT